jgi:ABC-type Mn2+/Zn2+ transport system permease subunit
MIDTIRLFKYFLMAGPIIGAMCALLSVYVVLRRMALISEGISHAGFGGFAVAILLGYFVPEVALGPLGLSFGGHVFQEVVAGVFCLGTALLIGYVTRRKRVSEDSAIGIFLVATVAIGQLLLQVRAHLPAKPGVPRVTQNVESLLFGDFTSVVRADVIVLAVTLVLVGGVIAALYHQFLYTTLDEEMARINGVNTRLINTLLLVMISVVVVICVRMVGFLMITALMIIPGATANMLSRKFGGVLAASLLIGTLSGSGATWLALVPPFDRYSPGPLVVLTLFAVFVVVWAVRHFFKPKVEGAAAPAAPAHEHAHPPGAFGSGHVH